MADPVMIFTASAIATLAFQKFFESSVGELGKKFTESAVAKMDELRKRIWARLSGKPGLEKALNSVVDQGSKADLERITAYLQVAMLDDPEFASDLQIMAQEINAGRLQDNSNMTQNNYDNAKGWQTKVEGGTAYVGEVHVHHSSEA
jgi:hypothetical protein